MTLGALSRSAVSILGLGGAASLLLAANRTDAEIQGELGRAASTGEPSR